MIVFRIASGTWTRESDSMGKNSKHLKDIQPMYACTIVHWIERICNLCHIFCNEWYIKYTSFGGVNIMTRLHVKSAVSQGENLCSSTFAVCSITCFEKLMKKYTKSALLSWCMVTQLLPSNHKQTRILALKPISATTRNVVIIPW